MDECIIKATDFNTPFLEPEIQKIIKNKELHNTSTNWIQLKYIETSIQNSRIEEKSKLFFSSTYGTFHKINHILGYKTNFNKFKRTEITQRVFFEHNGIKVKASK